MKKAIYSLLLMVLFTSYARSEIAIITHPSSTATFSANDVKNIYLGKRKVLSDGSAVVPLSLESGADASSQFCSLVLGRSEAQYQALWSKLVFTGKGTPPKEVSTAEMIELVSRNPDMLGFVATSDLKDTVKVVATY